MDKEYTVEYLPLFEQDVREITDYIADVLRNSAAADRLVDDVETAILKRAESNPTAYRKYHSVKDRKQPYYTIRVGNYYVFYVVIDNVMEVRRFIYAKRDLENLI
ncbi:MAG: type II toxin-antitoxin system RelE/ParE family toxin [Oscillospiraceae bacterium]|nr:type II toxin-antitoxin system RelE/ParE family toxin [Oscillospiraceae bacterium]